MALVSSPGVQHESWLLRSPWVRLHSPHRWRRHVIRLPPLRSRRRAAAKGGHRTEIFADE